MSERTQLLTPVGRIVGGNLYDPQTTDAEGKPLVVKSGPNAGQPRVDYWIALAIPKGNEQHWSQTEWGQKIWAAGHAAFPQAAASPAFAWKVVDGDSAVPNRKGVAPNSREGYKGHWVLNMSGSFAPKIYNRDGTQQILEKDAVKPGYYVQVFGSVGGNGSQQQPGVFINHSMFALAGYGPEIVVGPDAATVGFGAAALPAGASAAPVACGFNPAPAPAAMPPATPIAAPPQVPTVPHPGILAVPGAPAAPARVMTPAAGGASYEQMIAAGWNDQQLIAHGMMQA